MVLGWSGFFGLGTSRISGCGGLPDRQPGLLFKKTACALSLSIKGFIVFN
jgi:hypothetical protein